MILTCPECATSYFVDDSRIPEAGRTVKCASCGARWQAKRETAPIPTADDRPEPAAKPVHPGDAPPEEFADAAAEDVEIVAVPREAEEFPRAAARRAAAAASANARDAGGDARGKVAVLASAATLVVALVAGAIVLRSQVVKVWPKSQAAYAGLGLPVNSVGLVIEGVQATPTFLGGRPVLSVTGDIRNVKGEAVNSPALRVNLLNHAGKPVSAKIVRPIDPRVPAGATRHFAIAISDPPSNAQNLEVVFDAAQQTAGAPTQGGAPAPVDAKPLTPGSPEALPEHG